MFGRLSRATIGQVQAVVRQAVDRELGRVRLFLQQAHGLAAAVGPFHQQRHVQLAEAIPEPLLKLLLPHGDDAHAFVDLRGLGGGEEPRRGDGVIDDQVFEVLVVVLDADGSFAEHCNQAMVQLEPIAAEDAALEHLDHQGGDLESHGFVDVSHDMTRFDAIRLQQLILKHKRYTNSAVAARILDDWAAYAAQVRQGHAGGLPPRTGGHAGAPSPPAGHRRAHADEAVTAPLRR
jgi:hypothetical protein